jgi:hypothetical protein
MLKAWQIRLTSSRVTYCGSSIVVSFISVWFKTIHLL